MYSFFSIIQLGIKELAPIAEDVIIVTSSLTKDMTGKEDLYRPAAIRALCAITDVSNPDQIKKPLYLLMFLLFRVFVMREVAVCKSVVP